MTDFSTPGESQALKALSRLYTVAQHIAEARTPRALAELVVREAMDATGAIAGSAWMLDESGTGLDLLHGEGFTPELMRLLARLDVSLDLPVPRAVRNRAPEYVDDVLSQLPKELHVPCASGKLAAAMAAIPLLVEGRAVGALNLAYGERRAFDPHERSLLESLAQHCAQALERARLFEAEHRNSDRLRRLQQITAALSQALTPDEVAHALIEEAVSATGAKTAGLWLLSEDGASIELSRSTGFDQERRENYARFPASGTLPVAVAIRTGEPIFLETDEQLAAFSAVAHLQPTIRQGGRIAAVPLLSRGRAIGALSYRYPPGRFDAGDRAMLQMVGRCASEALERARLYESEREARRRAVEADRRKDEFLAMLGHELRNPLAPILTCLQVIELRDPHAFEKERTVISRQVQHLVRLVDDLLDVSRVTTGRIQLKRKPLDLAAIVAKAVEMASPLFEARAHRLEIAQPAERIAVMADEERLAQVIANILNNAGKYTEPGGRISISLSREGEDAVVRVRDSGVGIAADMLPRVFDAFEQESRSIERAQGGLGLGLAIARSLVLLHGGHITARSEGPGHGSEFEVRLPALEALPPEAPQPPRPQPAPQQQSRVLVVDDNADAADMLAEALRSLGYAVAVAYDGPSGLELARSFQPAVGLLDIGLPAMDGYELATRLRAELPNGVRLAAITGYGQQPERDKAKAAGFDEHLIKPVELDHVLDVVGRLADQTRVPSGW